jgi:L-alanine-DL-glutamate epimerase-like enolase superfamily enzyme
MRLESEILTLTTKHPFNIARWGSSDYRTVWIRLIDDDGIEGWGEAAPNKFYGETADTVVAALETYQTALPDNPFDLEGAERTWLELMGRNGSARAALSAALHDLAAKRLGVPLYQMWGLNPAEAPRSTYTIGIDTSEKIRQKVAEADQYPILKIKLGSERDREILETIRGATDKEIRVDANCGWTVKQAVAMLPILEEFDVTVLEQPLVPDDIDGFSQLTSVSTIPVIADESCVTSHDIPRLVGAVDGINIKLAKCGGLREALRMIAIARAHHMMVMVGCMVETSLAITAAAHFTPLVDIVDLDGGALLASDPFRGATIEDGQVELPSGPGLGVSRA